MSPISPSELTKARSEPLSNYVKEILVKDADELFKIFSSDPFDHGRWAFRGHASETWKLQPSLERLCLSTDWSAVDAEPYLFRAFRRRAHHYLQDLPKETLEWFALMQHHGSPTRLLDWSRSPYVAAFFAVAEAQRAQAAAIWAIDSVVARETALETLRECDARCSSFDRTDSLSEPDRFEIFLRSNTAVVAPVQPFRTNERLTIQQGLFLCPNSLLLGFEDCIKQLLACANHRIGGKIDVLFKLKIVPGAHLDTLRALHKMNISYATLFPGLDGFARSLCTNAKIRSDDNEFFRCLADDEFDSKI